MENRVLMPSFFIVVAMSSLFLFLPAIGFSGDSSVEPAPVASGVFEGEILEVEAHSLVIKQYGGDTVRVRMPGKSEKKSSEFHVGDKVEVVVSPEGITTSVRPSL